MTLALGVTVAFLAGIFLYLSHVNRAMREVPEEARLLSGRPWTVEEIKAAYKRNLASPVNVEKSIPPKQQRRYIVVGGSGLVGGAIVSHLLARGEEPGAIRVLDLHQPRPEVLERKLAFVKTNITQGASVLSAFAQPWPEHVAQLPLTVFHTAAVIRPFERHVDFLPLCTRVNVDGTKNVLDAAKNAGASCFIWTSSGSVCVHRPSFWIAPWSKYPKKFFQILTDSTEIPKSHDGFFGNYAVSKAQAERIVREADDPKSNFRTGCIRPTNGVYGVGGGETNTTVPNQYLSRGGSLTWVPHIIQHFVHAENVSIAHLFYEQRLIEISQRTQTNDRAHKLRPDIGGQAFIVTDPNPAISFGDLYNLLNCIAETPVDNFWVVHPVPCLILAHILEWYKLLQHRYLSWLLPPISGELAQLQPSLFSILDVHTIADDSRARKTPEEGGLGYNAPITTLDGLCMEAAHWNRTAATKNKTTRTRPAGASD